VSAVANLGVHVRLISRMYLIFVWIAYVHFDFRGLPNENCSGAYQETRLAFLIFAFGSVDPLPKSEDAIVGISTIAR
jgi:hypothetical protein